MLLNRLRDKAAGHSITSEPTATRGRATRSYGFQETPTALVHPVSENNSSVGLASLGDVYLEAQNSEFTSSAPLGPHQNVTKGSDANSLAASGVFSGVIQEMSNNFTRVLPIFTAQSSKTPGPLLPTKDSMMRQNEEKMTSENLHVSSVPTQKGKLKQESTTEVFLSKNIHLSNSAGFPPGNPGEPAPQTGPLGRPSKPWISQTKSDIGLIQEQIDNPSILHVQNPHPNSLDYNQTPAHGSPAQQQTPAPISHLPTVTTFYQASPSQTSSKYLVDPTKPSTLNSTFAEVQSSLLKLLSSSSRHKPTSDFPKDSGSSPSDPPTRANQTSQNQHQPQIVVTPNSSLEPLHDSLQTLTHSTTSRDSIYETTHPPSPTSQTQSLGQKQTQTLGSAQTFLTWRVYPSATLGSGKKANSATSHVKIQNPKFASTPSVTPLSTPDSLLHSRTNTVSATLPHHPTSLNPPGTSTGVIRQMFYPQESVSSPTTRNQPKTSPALSALPSPSPISDPPHLPFLQTSSPSSTPVSSFKPPLGSSHDLSSVQLRTTSPSSPTSQYITSSSFWTVSPATISPTPSSSGTNDSFISSASSATALPRAITTSTSTPAFSVDSISTTSLVMSSGSTSPHPAPSQVHRRSLSQPFTSTYSSVSSQQLPKDQGLLIQIPTAPSESHQKLSIPTPTMMVHPNPEPYPNFDPHLKANINKIEPNPPNTDTKTEHPTNAARTPGRDGKYPDTVPRHTSWELGMLLGCSAGLGMVLVVGLRYMYSQACGKRTVVTLNNREREYPRGERGLIHVQECGDLVRVRRIRDNSFVFLAEYDILASPGD